MTCVRGRVEKKKFLKKEKKEGIIIKKFNILTKLKIEKKRKGEGKKRKKFLPIMSVQGEVDILKKEKRRNNYNKNSSRS